MQIARGVVTFSSKNYASRLTLTKTTRVFTDITKVVRGSNIQWRGRSYAASVPSDLPKAQKGRKRVSKDERKAMVESFVNKYREMNAGKFPSADSARKEVGGSFYVIRKILQEIEYNSKISPLNKRNQNILEKELIKENESLTEYKEVSSSQMTVDAEIQNVSQKVAINGEVIGDSSDKHLEAKGDHFDFVATHSHLQEKETAVDSHPSFEKPEEFKEGEAVTEDLQEFDGPKHKTEQDQGSPKLDNLARNISEKQENDEELPKKPTVWGNLKSLADGIINMWRKL
ncbi:hypothetical protein L1049_028583 [Liquidambar formosana]|uniref:AT3G52170-like helix-turn-helix domain-containing protein n=1 Tax=Liquidambar formosana TaxID=63359 RepID=A0AAP0RMY3_LIQFO